VVSTTTRLPTLTRVGAFVTPVTQATSDPFGVSGKHAEYYILVIYQPVRNGFRTTTV